MVWHLKVTGTLEQESECVLHMRTAPPIDSPSPSYPWKQP